MSNTKTITSLNAIFMLTVPGVAGTAQQLEGFAADAMFSADDVQSVEAVQGVDGYVGFGLLPYMVVQTITIQPNSPSLALFNAWAQAQKTRKEVIVASGVISMKSIAEKYTLLDGALTGFKPIPDAKKVLQPVTFKITWAKVEPAEA